MAMQPSERLPTLEVVAEEGHALHHEHRHVAVTHSMCVWTHCVPAAGLSCCVGGCIGPSLRIEQTDVVEWEERVWRHPAPWHRLPLVRRLPRRPAAPHHRLEVNNAPLDQPREAVCVGAGRQMATDGASWKDAVAVHLSALSVRQTHTRQS